MPDNMKEQRRLNIAGRLGAAAMKTNMTPIISLLIFLAGVIALLVTPREENPQINAPAANVFVHMQGASSAETLNLVVRPLEMVLHGMKGVDHTFGMATDSLGVVTVMFKVGEDKEASLVRLYDHVMHNLDHIPPGASQPLVKPLDVDNVPVSVITLSSPGMDGFSLKRLAERVRDKLAALPGVSVTGIIGGRDHEVRIALNPARLAAYRIPLGQLRRALTGANAGGPMGNLVGENHVTRVWLGGYLKTAREVGRLIVGESNGKPVYLRGIASISDGPSAVTTLQRIGFGPAAANTPPGGKPGTPAVSITLAKKHGANTVVVTGRIRDKLNELRGDLIPDNVRITITRDSGQRANDAVNMLIEHLGVAIVTVVAILLLFLGWREAAIVTLNIPLILFTVLAVGLLAGQTINRITLFAMILSLGLLVDDAIVVIENIHRHLRLGAATLGEKARLIIAATNETGKPTIIATIAVILAFLPMHFVTGMMGPYMGPIPFNAPVAMIASLVIAYMFTPWIARRWMPCAKPPSVMETRDAPVSDRMQRIYMRLAAPLIDNPRRRCLFWLVVAILFAFALWEPAWQFVRPSGINGPPTPGTVELKMLPKGNQDTFNITIDMPEDTPLEATDAVARDVADSVRRHPMVTNYETFVGQAGPIDFNGMLRGAVFRKGPQLAEIRVNLVHKEGRNIESDAIVLELRDWLKPVRKRHPEANIKLVEDPPGPPVRATLLAEIYGPDYPTLRAIAKKVRGIFAHTWDVVDVDDSVTDDQTQWRVDINKEKAARLGVSASRVRSALVGFLHGYDVGVMHVSTERHPVRIRMRLPRALRVHASDLGRIYVSGAHGPVPLSAIATLHKSLADKPIFTKDDHQVAYVYGEPERYSQVYSLLDMDKRMDGKEILPDIRLKTGGMHFTETQPGDVFGYHLLWNGEMRLTLNVFRDLGAAFMVALVLIYLLMAAYYGDFTLPLLVMAPIPITMIGVFPGHWITGQSFTATSMIGMIALAGIVVRNSTLLIDFILDYRRQGYSLRESVLEAGAVRARPILLTALAVIGGSSIMISDPVFGGLGVSMAFGTLASTALTLFIVPMLYYLWQRNKPVCQDQLKEKEA
ncbi:MAG: efflux RND transporter permease subunit [Mariprofundaceae bacterium]|nr:efflux RND transporter permease subunit [Mariprofundaceae bacterium]